MKKTDSTQDKNPGGGFPIQLKVMLTVLTLGIVALVLKAAGII